MHPQQREDGTLRGGSFGPCSEDIRKDLSTRLHILRRIRRLLRNFPCQRPPLLPSGNGWLLPSRPCLGHRLREHHQHTSPHCAPSRASQYPSPVHLLRPSSTH